LKHGARHTVATIDIAQVLSEPCTRAGVDASSRKRLLEVASDLLAEHHPELSARHVFDELMARERLGSTGIGEGVAIPHCRTSCRRISGALLTLKAPVDFEAIDDEGVNLLFVLVVPEEETSAHLELLAALARVFSDAENRRQLRDAASDGELYQQLLGLFSSAAA
jgi:PTS system nitrogen regulatory IIA component